MEIVMSKKPLISPITSPPLHTYSQTNFPMIAIATIAILTSCFLLVSYYIFVIKCFSNRRHIDLLTLFSFSTRHIVNDPLTVHSPATENRGLDEYTIKSIPILEFKKVKVSECAVCLNEFEEGEKIRVIPFCGHFFHIDCIDVWLHKNANCPICRTSVLAHDKIILPHDQSTSSPQDSIHYPSFGEGDYVMIEIDQSQENSNSEELYSISLSHDKFEKPEISRSEGEKIISRVSSMGDSGRSVVQPPSLDP